MLEKNAKKQTPYQHWVREHFILLWQSTQRDNFVGYSYSNLRKLGRNSNESSILTAEKTLDSSITETHGNETQKVKLVDWGARNAWERQSKRPASVRALLPELELLPSPNSKRENANVLLRSWWRPKWIWLEPVIKYRGEATQRIEYLLVKYLHVVYWEINDGSFMRPIIKISLAIDT